MPSKFQSKREPDLHKALRKSSLSPVVMNFMSHEVSVIRIRNKSKAKFLDSTFLHFGGSGSFNEF